MIISEIDMCKYSLRTGINQNTRKVLKVEDKQKLEDLVKIDIYRLEHNKPTIEIVTEDNYRLLYEGLAQGIRIAVLSIVAIIIAGGAISNETSTGTIKFWALTPNRRWKILTAKILSLIFYIIIFTAILSLATILISNIFFDETGQEYVFVENGEVQIIGNTLYIIETYYIKTIPVIIFSMFALMLSTLTRNTSIAVSFSIAMYMGQNIFMTIINGYIKKDWIKFIPFNNMNIVDKIFINNQSQISTVVNSNLLQSTSLTFSLAVLGTCVLLMLVTTYDSFNQKDII